MSSAWLFSWRARYQPCEVMRNVDKFHAPSELEREMIRLQPEWVGELVSMWAANDWSEAQLKLGFPTVSPMFSMSTAHGIDAGDVTGYSNAELRAMAAGIDWLQKNHPEHYRALSREFRTWTRRTLERRDDDDQLVLEAGHLLAEYVDRLLG